MPIKIKLVKNLMDIKYNIWSKEGMIKESRINTRTLVASFSTVC